MEPLVLLALLVVGVAMGFVAGLVGIGGGVLIVPFLYFFYAHPEYSGVVIAPGLQATIAHATSLLVIVPTAVRGMLSYHRAGLVVWRAALPVAVAATLAAVVGARLAEQLPAPALKFAFAVVLVASGAQLMLRRRYDVEERPLRLGAPRIAVTGIAVGLFSAMLGVGGGIVAIPLLIHLIRLDVKRVAATSIAIVGFAAAAGTITYMVTGSDVAGRPPGSLGYVHLLAALVILPGSLLGVGFGAAVNQRLAARTLQYVFGVLFLLLGAQLIVENAQDVLDLLS